MNKKYEEYQYVSCRSCGITLRLKVLESSFGKNIKVTCTKCGAKFQTVVIDQHKLESLMQELDSAVGRAILGNNEVSEVICSLARAGFIIKMALIAEITESSRREPEVRFFVNFLAKSRWMHLGASAGFLEGENIP